MSDGKPVEQQAKDIAISLLMDKDVRNAAAQPAAEIQVEQQLAGQSEDAGQSDAADADADADAAAVQSGDDAAAAAVQSEAADNSAKIAELEAIIADDSKSQDEKDDAKAKLDKLKPPAKSGGRRRTKRKQQKKGGKSAKKGGKKHRKSSGKKSRRSSSKKSRRQGRK